jgi:hypothetical protein
MDAGFWLVLDARLAEVCLLEPGVVGQLCSNGKHGEHPQRPGISSHQRGMAQAGKTEIA